MKTDDEKRIDEMRAGIPVLKPRMNSEPCRPFGGDIDLVDDKGYQLKSEAGKYQHGKR